jgi:hypothetical protein
MSQTFDSIARRCGRQRVSLSWRIAAGAWTTWQALRESLLAYRRYERLTYRGVPHDTALRTAMAVASASADGRRTTAQQDHCACGDRGTEQRGSARIGNLAYVT